MNLEEIRARARRCANSRAAGDDWMAAAILSAADVPALIAEIEHLRDQVAELRHGPHRAKRWDV